MSATSISDALGAGQFSNFGEAVEALISAYAHEAKGDKNCESWEKEIARLNEALAIYKPLWKEERKRRTEARKAIAEKLRLAGHKDLADCLETNDFRSLAY